MKLYQLKPEAAMQMNRLKILGLQREHMLDCLYEITLAKEKKDGRRKTLRKTRL